jgi:hypothetical protein
MLQNEKKRLRSPDTSSRLPPVTRQLSFAKCNLDQLEDATVEQGADFCREFWRTVLEEEASQDFWAMQNQNLAFWVHVFNRWQQFGKGDVTQVPEKLNGDQVERVFGNTRKMIIIKLFDPSSFTRLSNEGRIPQIFASVKVPVARVITAGVLLSKRISTEHKLKFLFDLADTNDGEALDESQFTSFITNVIEGVGASFGVASERKIIPSHEKIASIAHLLFAKVSALAAKRLRKLTMNHHAVIRAAIKARQEQEQEGEHLLSPAGSMGHSLSIKSKPSLNSSMNSRRAASKPRQMLKYKVIEDWCFGVFRDVSALPYELLFRRFCPKRFGDDIVDEFDECISHLKLSHSASVPVPKSDTNIRKEDLLSRGDVLIVRDVFQFSVSRNTFRIELKDICKEMNLHLDRSLHTRLESALIKASEAGKASANLQQFFGYVCPISQAKHWRMFESWCTEYDALMEQDTSNTQELGRAVDVFLENDKKEMLPPDYVAKLREQFNRLDADQDGRVEAGDVKREWAHLGGSEADSAHSILEKWGLDEEDASVDLVQFVQLMCPEEYRPPEMEGFARKLLGKVLISEHEHVRDEVGRKISRFKPDKAIADDKIDLPVPLRPDVDAETLLRWGTVFDELDQDCDGAVDAEDIQNSGLVCAEVSSAIVGIVGNGSCFTRERFLSAVTEAHSFRPLTSPRARARPAG